jgi:hypothetical protein
LKLSVGKWRWLMATAFDDETYGQRWQVETVMFMLKRHFGSALTSRKYRTRRREMNLCAVTHNLMILLPAELSTRHSSPRFMLHMGATFWMIYGIQKGAFDETEALHRS